jgi:hypothetical protein
VEALANGNWLDRPRIIRVAGLCGLASIACIALLFATSHGTLDYRGRPLGTDFSNVWAAGWMALHGQAADAWIWSKHFAVQKAIHGPRLTELYGWHYPPPFLLIASALATLPYVTALIVWQVATLAPLAWMMQKLVPRRETLLLTLAAPVTLVCLLHGHNGFLTAVLLGGGLALLERRPLLAGLLLGCLIYKPQFGPIVPVLLIAGRHWRSIGGATLSASALIAVTLAIWGWPVWHAFFASLPLTQHIVIEQGVAGWYKIMSPFAAMRMLGAGVGSAYMVQTLALSASLAAVAWVGWTRKAPDLRNALVCAAALISTPYVLDYDYVVLLPAIAFLVRDAERNGWRSWEKTLLALVWIAPLAARQIAQITYVPLGLATALIVAAIALRRTSGHRHSAVDVQRLPGDVAGFAASEIDARRADVLAGTHRAHRNA